MTYGRNVGAGLVPVCIQRVYMKTSAEQVHQGDLSIEPGKDRKERLYINLDVCASGKCKECVIKCSYLYHRQTGNNGIFSVAELANYALVCRKCDEPHCIASCPQDALEQTGDKTKLLMRYNMRCVSCKSCSHACPYGTIYPENVPYLVHNCDFCMDRRNQNNEPLCISTCPYGALSIQGADIELDDNTFLVGDNLMVHSTHWERG